METKKETLNIRCTKSFKKFVIQLCKILEISQSDLVKDCIEKCYKIKEEK